MHACWYKNAKRRWELKGFQFLRHLRLHTSIFLTPTVIRLFENPKHLASIRNRLSFTQLNIRSA